MFAAMHNNDNVGLFLFTDTVEKYAPARKGRKHVLSLLSRLVSFEPGAVGTNLEFTLAHISRVVRKRSIIFIISDFFTGDFYRPLRILRNRHDVIAVRILDERELEIPDVGLIELEDEETGEQILVDTSDEKFRENFRQLIQNARTSWARSCERQTPTWSAYGRTSLMMCH